MTMIEDKIELQRNKCEMLRQLAHEAPLNAYRVNANRHRWVEQVSSAWSSRSNDWIRACDDLKRMEKQLSLGD